MYKQFFDQSYETQMNNVASDVAADVYNVWTAALEHGEGCIAGNRAVNRALSKKD